VERKVAGLLSKMLALWIPQIVINRVMGRLAIPFMKPASAGPLVAALAAILAVVLVAIPAVTLAC